MSWKNGAGMDITECVTSNPLRLQLEARAREDAAAGIYNPPSAVGSNYGDCMMREGMGAVYHQAYEKRRLRIERMKDMVA